MPIRQYLVSIIIISAALFLGTSLGLLFVHSHGNYGNKKIVSSNLISTLMPNIRTSAQATASVMPEKPKQLSIPKFGVQATIEEVGLDAAGSMDVPKQPADVAWYGLGAVPGQRGNAVIDGHLDSKTGPAVFYRLGQLETGDQIIVTDSTNQKHLFRVSKKETYPFDKVPLNTIFGEAASAHLNLITCSGHFDRPTQNYSQRVVVYSDLITSS